MHIHICTDIHTDNIQVYIISIYMYIYTDRERRAHCTHFSVTSFASVLWNLRDNSLLIC